MASMPKIRWQRFLNPYWWITFLALLWLLFLDNYNWIAQWRFSRRLAQMEAQYAFYEQAIAHLKTEAHALKHDPYTQEKYARAYYWVHRPNEWLFILQPTD